MFRSAVGIVGLLVLLSGCNTMQPLSFSSRAVFDVRGFGAVGDGKTLDTVAFRHAIEAVRQLGGGTVRVPAGNYLVQPLDLVSGLTLSLEQGAVVTFSDDPDDYGVNETRWEGIMRPARRACILGRNLTNVAIIGPGTLDGAGARWWRPIQSAAEQKLTAAGPVPHPWETDPLSRRPPLVQLRDCSNVNIDGVTFRNPPHSAVHLLFSSNVEIANSKFLAPAESPGTVGVEVDSSSNVTITSCHADVGDDGFAIKSGKDEDGRRIGRPSENVTIRNCSIANAMGGLAIGSEMSGGVRRVRFFDCRFDGTAVGVRISTVRGRGGAIEDVRVANLVMNDVGAPFTITMRARPTTAEPTSARTPAIRNVRVSDIKVRNAARAGIIEGLEERPVSQLVFRNLDITARYGISCSWADDIDFKDVSLATDFGPAILRTDTTNLRLDNWQEATRQMLPVSQPATTRPATTQSR